MPSAFAVSAYYTIPRACLDPWSLLHPAMHNMKAVMLHVMLNTVVASGNALPPDCNCWHDMQARKSTATAKMVIVAHALANLGAGCAFHTDAVTQVMGRSVAHT